MKIMFAGDTHGNVNHWLRLFEIAEEEEVGEIIQVGDFGYWEHMDEGVAFLDVLSENTPCLIRFIDGNHDNHPLLWERYPGHGGQATLRQRQLIPTRANWPTIIYQQRGSVRGFPGSAEAEGDITSLPDGLIMQFMGGAFSIDYQWRVRMNKRGNECWWPEETITDEQVESALNAASGWFEQIDVLVAHDVPRGAPMGRLTNLNLSKTLENMAKPNRDQLLKLVRGTMPRLLIHGHYHTRLDYFMHYEDPAGERRRLDCISLSCDPESHHSHSPMEDSYIILTQKEILEWST